MLGGNTTCGREHLTSSGTRFGDCRNLGVVRVTENEAGAGLLSIPIRAGYWVYNLYTRLSSLTSIGNTEGDRISYQSSGRGPGPSTQAMAIDGTNFFSIFASELALLEVFTHTSTRRRIVEELSRTSSKPFCLITGFYFRLESARNVKNINRTYSVAKDGPCEPCDQPWSSRASWEPAANGDGPVLMTIMRIYFRHPQSLPFPTPHVHADGVLGASLRSAAAQLIVVPNVVFQSTPLYTNVPL